TEESSFQDFLRTAELAGTEFQAEKLNLQFLIPKANAGVLSDNQTRELREKHKANEDLLKIPRRPKWTAETTGEELQKAENEAFLEWRRGLSVLQEDEGILMTPYEKNLEFWRQLWRVVEKSDVIIQIVDARNPLLFRSEDLEKYVKEVDKNKMNMILINKADLLTEQQRVHWADFFDKEGMRVAFFSAILVEEENQSAAKDVEIDEKTKIEIPESDDDDDDDESDEEEVEDKSEDIKESTRKLSESLSEIEEQVSDILLCDCPGLVMPSFVLTKADMVLNGILPIDQ
uniref:G domain-containing protein n=1 Tax=Megaselia scalaris TaxID=36166 RepID=T1GQ09_MEGSC